MTNFRYQTETQKNIENIQTAIYDEKFGGSKAISDKKEIEDELEKLQRGILKSQIDGKAKEFDPDNKDSDQEISLDEEVIDNEEEKEELNDWKFNEKFNFELSKYTNTFEQVIILIN